MRGKTHCIIGILSSMQASILFNIPMTLLDIFISSFFCLLPDLDESNSLISNTLLKRSLSMFLYKSLVFIINLLIFIISFKINNNLFISSIFTFFTIFIVTKKINHKNVRKYFISFLFLFLAFCLFLYKSHYYIILFTLLLSIFPWLKHRSFSHSILSIIVIYVFLKQIEVIFNILHISFFGTISYASHIFLGDIFTKQGVPIFYPITDKRFSLAKLKVGKKFSNLMEVLFVLILVFTLFYSVINI